VFGDFPFSRLVISPNVFHHEFVGQYWIFVFQRSVSSMEADKLTSTQWLLYLPHCMEFLYEWVLFEVKCEVFQITRTRMRTINHTDKMWEYKHMFCLPKGIRGDSWQARKCLPCKDTTTNTPKKIIHWRKSLKIPKG